MAEVGATVLGGPLLHRRRHRVGDGGIQGQTLPHRLLELAEDVLGEPLEHHVTGKGERAEAVRQMV